MRRAFLTLAALAALILAVPAVAQNPFSAAVTVNDRVVTYYEIDQRARFFQLLNAPGDARELAYNALVDERLQLEAADRLGLLPSDEDLIGGMNEFAGRANMTAEQFIQQLAPTGVAGETFRDFVYAGLAWRNVVRGQFGPRAQVTEEEVDRALALARGESAARVRLAEIIVPLTPATQARVAALMDQLSTSLEGDEAGFSAAARRYSAAGSARSGGDVGWRPVASLPPPVRAVVLALPPGGVTDPVRLGESVAIFQLRDFEEEAFVSPEDNAVSYALIPVSGPGDAENLRDSLDTCDDLYGVRPGGFTLEALPADQVPGDVAAVLAGLDANEGTTGVTGADGAALYVMLCGRTTELPEGFREQTRQALFNQRLESYARGFLAELRADAIITEAE